MFRAVSAFGGFRVLRELRGFMAFRALFGLRCKGLVGVQGFYCFRFWVSTVCLRPPPLNRKNQFSLFGVPKRTVVKIPKP